MDQEDVPSEEVMRAWLREIGVEDLVPAGLIERAYRAFTRCPFGAKVPEASKRRFFRRLAPYVS
jgi:hypothetical protein